jgi:hypothetical protein
METQAPENPSNGVTQNDKAKSQRARLIAKLARFVRKAGLSYDDWRAPEETRQNPQRK